MSGRLDTVLDGVTRVRGVRAAVLASQEDGLVVAAALRDGEDGETLAALAAALAHRLRRAGESAGTGRARFLHVRAEHGMLCASPAGPDLLVLALADATANLGLVRLALLQAVEETR